MKKRLVFFIGGLNFGGMERVVFIAKDLLSKDYDIKIVTLYQDNADYEKNVNYYNLDVPPSRHKLLTFIKRFIRTVKMKKKLSPDYVFSFGMYSNYLNVFSNFFIKEKPKTLTGIRSYDWLTIPFVSRKMDKFVINKFDSVSSVSKLIAQDAEYYWNIPKKNNKVIYNPYDISMIQDKSKEKVEDFTFEKNKYYIISTGRLADQKGFNHLIRTMSEVIKEIPSCILLILGNGSRMNDLINMIKNYNLEKNILLLGGKTNPYKYIKKSNLYVLSSHTEGFPNALCEAMCVGTPVISTNCKSGPSEILLDSLNVSFNNDDFIVCNYGLLSKELNFDTKYDVKELSESEKSLKEAIIYAYNNRNTMYNNSINAQKRMNDFSYDTFYENLVKFIN